MSGVPSITDDQAAELSDMLGLMGDASRLKDRAPIADRLRSSGVVAMRADWTRPDPVVTAYVQSFGATACRST